MKMKRNVFEFIRRGLCACGLGPLVLAVIYLILQSKGVVEVLTVNEVCTGIISLTVLAFIAGGANILYGVEKLPLMAAILIHGVVLYITYLATYMVNGWLDRGITPILVFSVIFVVGYIAIWAVIYCVTRRNTSKVNEKLSENNRKSC